MVLPDSHRVSRALRYLGTTSAERGGFHLRDFHPLWWFFPEAFGYPPLFSLCGLCLKLPRNPCSFARAGLCSSPFPRPYWGNLGLFLFLAVLGCFPSPRSPS